MTRFLTVTRHDDVAVLEIDNPPVNALSPGVPEAVADAVDGLGRESGVSAIVIRGAGRFFAAGADITRLERAAWGDDASAPDWHQLFQRIEDSSVPVVMAIHGAALGGGLELAMTGHFRVSTADARLGQPEVTLGLIPGGEGTQRLPRLAGVETALELCVTGEPISGADAARLGIVDAVADEDLTTFAVAFARRVRVAEVVRTRDRRDRLGSPFTNVSLFESARARAVSVRPHEHAPLAAIAALEAAVSLPFEEGCRRERELFLERLRSGQARALIHVFFATRAAGKSRDATDAVGQRLKSALTRELDALVGEGFGPGDIRRALSDFGVSVDAIGWSPSGDTAEAAPGGRARGEVVDRYVCTLINEGAKTVEEGAVARASDVDVAALAACGFPAWRGGPLFHADSLGLRAVVETISMLERLHGPHWAPAQLLIQLAQSGSSFRERDRAGGQ